MRGGKAMVTTVYLIRHGEAEGNIGGFFQGRTDCSLSEKGKEQLCSLSERFLNIDIEKIYSSPLKRAAETAKAVNKYKNVPIVFDGRLSEIDGGDWEGENWDVIPERFPESYKIWKNSPENFKAENGESMRDVYDRMKEALEDIAAKNAGKIIAVVSHGCALRNFLCYAKGHDLDRISEENWLLNTSVSLAEYDSGEKTWRIIMENNVSHLAEAPRALPDSI